MTGTSRAAAEVAPAQQLIDLSSAFLPAAARQGKQCNGSALVDPAPLRLWLTPSEGATYKARNFFQQASSNAVPKRNGDRGRAARLMLCAAACIAAWAVGSSAAAPPGDANARIIDNLYSTYFVSGNEGWAVGAFGSIFNTKDAGAHWQAQQSHTLEQLFGVAFADAQNGWVVGRTGIVLHTTTGGARWERQATGNEKHLFHVAALDTQNVSVVGDWGAILATHDGGATWQDHTLERDVILYSQSWPDSQHAWIVGEMGAILHSGDGGASWQDQTSGVEKTLFGVHFVDTQRGWACGLDGLILRTTDGGASWTVQRGNSEVGALEQVGVAEAFENASLYDINVNGDVGYAVGDIGSIFVSMDGGQTWQRKQVPGEWKLGWIRGLALTQGAKGMFVGANGLTVRVDGERVTLPQKN